MERSIINFKFSDEFSIEDVPDELLLKMFENIENRI